MAGFFETVLDNLTNIFSSQFFLDVFIIVILIITFFTGFLRKTWFSLFHVSISLLFIFIAYAVVVNPMASWFCNDAFKMFGYSPTLTMKYSGEVVTFEISSFYDLIRALARYSPFVDQSTTILSDSYCYALALGISRCIVFILLIVIILMITWIITLCLLPIIHKIIVNSPLSKFNPRWLGGLISTTGMLITIMLMSWANGAVCPGFSTIFEAFANGTSIRDDSGIISGFSHLILSLFNGFNPSHSHLFSWLAFGGSEFKFILNGVSYSINDSFLAFSKETFGITNEVNSLYSLIITPIPFDISYFSNCYNFRY